MKKLILGTILIALMIVNVNAQKETFKITIDKMKDLYIGVDNPITISVPGVKQEDLRPKITAGLLMPKGGGKYIVKLNQSTKTVKISLSADKNGKTDFIGSQDFVVKTIPDPIVTIANKKGGKISKDLLIRAGALIPTIENFGLDVTFVITEFSLSVLLKNNEGTNDLQAEKSTGNKLSARMIKMITDTKGGQKVYIEDIKAKGPDGTIRTLTSLNFDIE